MPLPDLLQHLADVQAKVNAYAEQRVNQWSRRHQEEKTDRRAAFKWLKSRH
jgi:hypothetical protein